MAVVTESEFKGNAMIVLKRSEDDRFPFQFGLSKAKLMLEAVEEIRAWVAKTEAKKPKAGVAASEE
jgi:hypothetical protein